MISTWTPESQSTESHSMRDMPHKMKESMSCSMNQLHEVIEKYPMTSMMVGLGVGFGAGLWLAGAYQHSSSRPAKWRDSFAQRIGHRVMDSLREVVPSSWMERLHA